MPAPTYISDELGADNDTIYVVLNGQKVITSEGWEHTEGIMAQPSEFNIRFGWSNVAAGLIQQFPKGTPFEIFIAGNQQATGKTDGPECDQPAGGPSTVTLHGRDLLAKLHDTYVREQVPVAVGTYAELVWFALRKCGLVTGASVDPNILRTDNAANRQIKTGVPILKILPHRTVQQILDDFGEGGPGNTGAVASVPQAKVGETWLRFVRRHCDRAGLFLWSAADGTFVLSSPDGNQQPSYSLVRLVDSTQGGNIIGCKFKNVGTGRHTEAVIYGRGGGKALGRVKAKGGFKDEEMIDAGYGDQPIVFRDVHTHSSAEAALFARRKLAEERRNGFLLEYTVSGLTMPYLPSGGSDRAVICVDTVVQVQDEHLGIDDNFYIESVTRKRSPETTTAMRLMRLADLIFGTDDDGE